MKDEAAPPARAVGAIVAAVVALALLRAGSLALYPLTDNTEARYGDIARRMAERSDWITPWFTDALPFWGKPPLSFWLSAGSFKLFGVGEMAARLPQFVVGCMVLVLVWKEARRFSSRQAAHAIALLAGSIGFVVASGAVMTDIALTLGVVLMMRGLPGIVDVGAPPSGAGAASFGVGAAVALLAKGPIGIALIAIALLGWLAWARPCGLRRAAGRWLVASLVAAALAVPWYVLAEWKTPGFLEYFLVGEHWHRFLTPGWKGDRYGSAHVFPRGSIWVFALLATLPWPPLLAALAWRTRRIAAATEPGVPRALAGWWLACGLAPLVLFTFAGNILWTYVLPGLPGLALSLSAWTSRRRESTVADRTLASGVGATALAAIGVLAYALATGRIESNSARAVVALAKDVQLAGEPLYFLAPMPYSAAFYSDGRALEVATLDDLRGRDAAASALVVAPRRAFATLDVAPAARLQRLASVGGYELARWR